MIVDYALLAFYAFAAAAVMSAVAVISVRNPVHAALFLVLTFFTVACTWILAGAEFLGIALILVYVGAVMVLFLFVVMMLDIDVGPLREGFVSYLPVGLLVAVVMLAEMLTLIGIRATLETPFAGNRRGSDPGDLPNTTWLAQSLLTDFLRRSNGGSDRPSRGSPRDATLRRRTGQSTRIPTSRRGPGQDRFRLVQMDAVKPAQPEPADDAPTEAATQATGVKP